jgi:HEAT repeat protein
VILRAALEAIGPQRATDDPIPPPVGDPPDEVLLVSHLSSLSRDVRAAAVHGLRDLCNTQAIAPLSQLQSTEPTAQVLQAITEALRVLRTDPCQ